MGKSAETMIWGIPPLSHVHTQGTNLLLLPIVSLHKALILYFPTAHTQHIHTLHTIDLLVTSSHVTHFVSYAKTHLI